MLVHLKNVFVVFALLLFGNIANGQAITSYPLYSSAVTLTAKVDALEVETHFLRQGTLPNVTTFCNVFLKRAADTCAVPGFPQALANTQFDYLAGPLGLAAQWTEQTRLNAQRLSNRGYFVVAAWKNPDLNFQNGHGHIAWVRPSSKDVSKILLEGPDISQAGYTNYKKTTVAVGFGNGRAWTDSQQLVRFFAYKLPTSQ